MQRQAGKPVIGIVGGIGSGKSTVADEFARLGCVVIDADRIGHELLADPDIQARLRDRWGEGIFWPDGQVNRKTISNIVFGDPEQLAALNAIMHPPMGERIGELIARLSVEQNCAAVVLDAAVLFEAGWDGLCTHLVFVSATPDVRADRAKAQRGWDMQQWRRRENAQISLDTKARKCDYIIDNSSTGPHLREQVRQLFHRIVHAANRP